MSTSTKYPEFRFIEQASYWLDNKFRVPGTRIRFGLDPLIGLIPVVGDIVSYFFSSWLILLSAKYGVSGKVMILMIMNLFLDTVAGSIPVVGQLFDFGYMANLKNLELLRKHHEEGKYKGKGTGLLLLLVSLLLAGLAGLIYGVAVLINWLAGEINNVV